MSKSTTNNNIMLQQLFGGVGDGPVPLKLTPNSTYTSKQACSFKTFTQLHIDFKMGLFL